MIDGYVFKIAMDKAGKVDNWAEFSLSQELQPFVTKCYECNGLIIVSEYVTVISKEEFQDSKDEIRQILSHLADGYLLGDVGAINKNFLNWGYRPDGSLVILDYGYVYRIVGNEMVCEGLNNDDTICQTQLAYDQNFNKLICPKCGKQYTFHEIRRKISREYEEKEINAIKQIAYKLTKPLEEINIKVTPTNVEISTNEGEEKMSKKNYNYDYQPEPVFDEDEYLRAIDFMGNIYTDEDTDVNVVSEPIDESITDDVEFVELDVPEFEDDDDDDEEGVELDDILKMWIVDDEEDESDITVDDAENVIKYESEIEEKNDELEEVTGIPDEELNKYELESEDNHDDDTIEAKFTVAYPSTTEIDPGAVDHVDGNIRKNIIDNLEITGLSEAPEVSITIEEPSDVIDMRVSDIEGKKTSVNIEINTSSDTTVAINTNDDTIVLTSPEEVDKMREMLSVDIEEDEIETKYGFYEDMYEDAEKFSKNKKPRRSEY